MQKIEDKFIHLQMLLNVVGICLGYTSKIE